MAMKVTLFGATGKTGVYILKELLSQSHQVTVLVRNPAKLGDYASQVNVVVGDVLDLAKVKQALLDSQAVISALGHVKGSPADMQTRAMTNIITAMQQNGQVRLIDLTGAGVSAQGDAPNFIDRGMTKLLSVVDPNRIKDGESHVKLIMSHPQLAWTIVRTPLQLSYTAKGDYRVGMVGDKHLRMWVARNHIAKFIVDNLDSSDYVHKLPTLG